MSQTRCLPAGHSFALALILCVPLGCDPYERRLGEYYAGAVDPARFPAAYLGQGGVGNRPGSGVFAPSSASLAGKQVVYYSFPFPAHQAGKADPLSLAGIRLPLAYVFDPTDAEPQPDKARCAAPAGYRFDQQKEAYRLDEQGNHLNTLPSATNYLPLYAQVRVTTRSLGCQGIKSEETLVTHEGVSLDKVPAPPAVKDGMPSGKPDGKIVAWPVIDPSADVLASGEDPDKLPPEAALGPQRWGWHNHYLLAYLDGGYVPTKGQGDTLSLSAQKIYYPRTRQEEGMMMPVAGKFSDGFHVLSSKRGEMGYSPICQVASYEPKDPKVLAKDVAEIDPMTVKDEKVFFYCLQLR